MGTHAVKTFLRAPSAISTALALAIIAGLASFAFLSAAPLERFAHINLGRADPTILQGFYRGETSDTGRGLRWTNGNASIELPALGFGEHIIDLTIAAPRQTPVAVPITIAINDISTTTILQPNEDRIQRLLAPARMPLETHYLVSLTSDTFSAAETPPRTLGVVVFDIAWHATRAPDWLPAAQALALALLIFLYVSGLFAIRVQSPLLIVLLVMLIAITLATRQSDMRFLMRWNALILSAAIAFTLGVLLAIIVRWRPPPTGSLPAGAWARRHLAALAGYALMVTILFAPLALQPDLTLIGAPGDNFEYAWKLGWFVEALLQRTTSPILSPQIYYPSATELTISEMTPAHTLFGMPLVALAGPVAGYNIIVMLSFVLTGWCAYLLACRLGADRGAAWVAGLMFALTLSRVNHAAEGHLGFLGSQWPLLALYGWEGVLRYRRTWDAHVAAFGLAMTFWSSWHYGTTLPLALAIYTMARLGWQQTVRLARHPQPFIIGAFICIPLVAPLAQPYVDLFARGDTIAHPYWELVLHAASPGDYLLPSPYHPLWGDWAARLYGRSGGEFLVTPGLSVIALGLAGLWITRRRAETLALALIGGLMFILSLGPEWRVSDQLIIPPPARWLFEQQIPLYGDIRTWGRMAIYVALVLALLAAQALSAPRRRWAVVGAGVIAAGELAFAMPLSSAAPRPVDAWLREQPGSGSIVQFPRGVSGPIHYWTRLTAKPTSQGSGKYAPPLYREERDTLFSFPSMKAVQLAQRWGIDYIVVNDAALAADIPDWRSQARRLPHLHEVYQRDGYTVFQVFH